MLRGYNCERRGSNEKKCDAEKSGQQPVGPRLPHPHSTNARAHKPASPLLRLFYPFLALCHLQIRVYVEQRNFIHKAKYENCRYHRVSERVVGKNEDGSYSKVPDWLCSATVT